MKIIAGPCQVESVDHTVEMARRIRDVSRAIGLPIVFKASFDKANRTSYSSPRGAGIAIACKAFARIRREFGLSVLTDVHEAWQCEAVADFVDIIQIPALLCRQTDLIAAAARTGRTVNIKKGQFLAPDAMEHAVAKAHAAGASVVWATERGTTFGYNDLVVDMRSIPAMKAAGADEVIFDCTHSVQTPGSLGSSTGGRPDMTETLARAAVAAGADGLFIETHDNPAIAPSDGSVMMPIGDLQPFLQRMLALHEVVAAWR